MINLILNTNIFYASRFTLYTGRNKFEGQIPKLKFKTKTQVVPNMGCTNFPNFIERLRKRIGIAAKTAHAETGEVSLTQLEKLSICEHTICVGCNLMLFCFS